MCTDATEADLITCCLRTEKIGDVCPMAGGFGLEGVKNNGHVGMRG